MRLEANGFATIERGADGRARTPGEGTGERILPPAIPAAALP